MHRTHTSFALGLLAVAITLGLAVDARAAPQDTAQRAGRSATTQTPTHGSAQREPQQLGTIVVTATRRNESIQNVPGGVTSVTASFLDTIHASSFEQFAAFVPGLSYASAGPTSDIIAIRGVTIGSGTLSNSIGMYLNEVPIGASTPFGLGYQTMPINTFDLNRVEVLKGPQGTLYGANALGGAIKYVPTPPALDRFGALAAATVSNTAHAGTNYKLAAMLNAPIRQGKLALRVDGVQQYDTGFGHNTLLGIDNQGSAHTTMGRVQLLASITPDLDFKLFAFSQEIRGNGLNVDFRDIHTGRPVQGVYDQQFGLRQPASNTLRVFSGTLNWTLPWATLTSITSYQKNRNTPFTDLSAIYNPVFALFGFSPSVYGMLVDTSTTKKSEELRLQSPDDQRFEWLLGGYVSHETTNEFIDLGDRSNPDGLLFGFSPFLGWLPSVYRETSVFADGTYHFTDKFDVTLGLRYSRNRQRYQQFASGWLVLPATPGVTTHQNSTSKQHVTTWLFNPRYHITKNLMVYAKAASGYRPGGPNFVLQLGQGGATFQPDKLWNYEIGEKATFLDGHATLNADVYDIRWSRIQLIVNNSGINQIVNAGSARIRGAEISAAIKPAPHLLVTASGAYTDAKLTSPVPALGLTQSGSRLPFSPRFNVALAVGYDFNVGSRSSGQLTLSDTWVGDRTAGYEGSLVAPYYSLPGYNTTNLDLAIFAPHGVEVDAFVHNLFDQVGQVSANTAANQYNPPAPVPVVLSQPRTIGVRVSIALGHPY